MLTQIARAENHSTEYDSTSDKLTFLTVSNNKLEHDYYEDNLNNEIRFCRFEGDDSTVTKMMLSGLYYTQVEHTQQNEWWEYEELQQLINQQIVNNSDWWQQYGVTGYDFQASLYLDMQRLAEIH